MAKPALKIAPQAPKAMTPAWTSLILEPLTNFKISWGNLLTLSPDEMRPLRLASLKALMAVTAAACLLHSFRFYLEGFGGGAFGMVFVLLISVIGTVSWSAFLYARLFLILMLLESVSPAVARLKSDRLMVGLLVPSSLAQLVFFCLSMPETDRGVQVLYGTPTILFCLVLGMTLRKLFEATGLVKTVPVSFYITLAVGAVALTYFSEYNLKVWTYSFQLLNALLPH